MVDSKKLQVEIEKTIKKSDDLNLNFDNTLKKMYIPTNSENKKKKIMTDLRRDVKKMHKFLENFRNWQKNDICKQKEISKQIREIEDREVSFKSLDLKTANAVVESDGEEITCLSNNNQLVRWIERCIKQILSHQDKIVIQLDGLQHSKRKRGSREKQQKMENYRKLIECHEYHAKYCRLILKGVHNHTIKLSQVEYLIPKLDDYIRNNAYDENSKLFYERLYIFEDDLDADSTSTQSKDSDKELNSDTGKYAFSNSYVTVARSTSVESTVSKLSNLIAPSSSETIENETKDNILTYLSTEECLHTSISTSMSLLPLLTLP
ncbi:hypothetical protein A3Q56_07596 [Intoshia linei]|uniref:CCR4-Not complex component Not N-terminal domain-containing protein n=1 Tax=Intoshia linei TaxID=1819745 RepID=A0A177ARS3_9BILA|nr:hypothetical protein A3Q56_07596 [Intoshia linei]